jgi:hypothetical protein
MLRTLTEEIESQTLELIGNRVIGSKQLPFNSFTKHELTFDYNRVKPKYQAICKSEERIVIYKGGFRGNESKGFLSLALQEGLVNHVLEVKELIEEGNDERIRELFDKHTSYYSHTSLLSATFNPEQAQVFASGHLQREMQQKTIYQLTIPANRCVLDIYDTGNCGSNREILILGAIFPDEISAVKVDNSSHNSELITPCGHYIRWHPDNNSTNTRVKNPDNWNQLTK